MKCILCRVNEADKTGSHIVPHFVLKRIDNEEKSTQRDKEMGFMIGKNPNSYFGRSTSIETLEKIYGEVSDKLILENTIPLIEDKIFCSVCEKKLSLIENEYAKTIDVFNDKLSNYQSHKNGLLCFLFWISIVWRLSMSKNSGFSLKGKNERLRRILSKYMALRIEDIKFDSKDNDLKKIGYKLLRCANYSKNNSTILFCHPLYKRPYYFIIDEYILILHIDGQYIINKGEHTFNLKYQIKNAVYNTPFQSEKIKNIEESSIRNVNEIFLNKAAEYYLSSFSEDLDRIHTHLGGKGKLPIEIKNEIISKLISDDEKLGVKYTDKHKAKIIAKVLKKYLPK